MTVLHFRLFQGKLDLPIWGGSYKHQHTKSYRHQIRLGDLGFGEMGGGGVNSTDTKLYRPQIRLGDLWGGGRDTTYKHQHTKSYRHQIGLGNLGGWVNCTDTKSYRPQIGLGNFRGGLNRTDNLRVKRTW